MTDFAAGLLHQALYDRLSSDSTLMNQITGVYDYVPEQTLLPYISIGEGTVSNYAAKDFTGQEHVINLHLWSAEKGGSEIRNLSEVVHDLVNRQPLTLTGHDHLSMDFEFFEQFFDADGETRHGVMRFRARTISQSYPLFRR